MRIAWNEPGVSSPRLKPGAPDAEGLVVELDDEKIVIEQYPNAEEAIEASKKYVGVEGRIQELEKEKKRLEEKLKEIESSLAALKKKLKEE